MAVMASRAWSWRLTAAFFIRRVVGGGLSRVLKHLCNWYGSAVIHVLCTRPKARVRFHLIEQGMSRLSSLIILKAEEAAHRPSHQQRGVRISVLAPVSLVVCNYVCTTLGCAWYLLIYFLTSSRIISRYMYTCVSYSQALPNKCMYVCIFYIYIYYI